MALKAKIERGARAWGPRAIGVVIAAGLGAGGCARIKETTTFTHATIGRRSSMEVVPASIEYSARAALQGRFLLVELQRAETCRTTVVPLLRKESHTRRELADGGGSKMSAPSTTLLLGLTALGLGVFSYLDAERLSGQSDDPEQSTPEDFRQTGLLLTAGSVGLLGVALIDSMRLRDRHQVVGEVDGPPEVTSALCRRAPAAQVAVELFEPRSTWKAAVRTDATGRASVDLLSLEERAFTGAALPLQLAVAGQRLPVELAAAEAEALRARLLGDAASRLAQDRERKLIAECESKVAGARAYAVDERSGDEEVADAERAWQRAEELCGPRWTAAYGEERDALRAQVTRTAAARAIARCQAAEEAAEDAAEEAIARRFQDEVPVELEALSESVHAACAGATNAKNVLARWARQAAVAAAAAELEQNLDAHDAVALRAQLRDPNLAAAFRQPPLSSYFPPLASYWLGALASGAANARARAQLCAARALYLSFLGKPAWAKLRAEVARSFDVMKAAQLIRAMDGGGCR